MGVWYECLLVDQKKLVVNLKPMTPLLFRDGDGDDDDGGGDVGRWRWLM